MGIEKNGELLVLPGYGGTYLVEFDYVVELCNDLKISHMPCLTKRYLGVTNYKGTVIPIVRLEDGCGDSCEENLILVIQCQKYQLGILLPMVPYSVSQEGLEFIQNPAQSAAAGEWCEKGLCRLGEELVFLLDVERSVGELILYP